MPGLELLHRDTWIAAFSKPSGLLVHRGWADDDVVAVDLAREALGLRVHPATASIAGPAGCCSSR